MVRLLVVLVGTLVFGGAGAIYVWHTLNKLFRGDADWLSVLLALVVLFAIAGLVYGVMRYFNNFEEPR